MQAGVAVAGRERSWRGGPSVPAASAALLDPPARAGAGLVLLGQHGGGTAGSGAGGRHGARHRGEGRIRHRRKEEEATAQLLAFGCFAGAEPGPERHRVPRRRRAGRGAEARRLPEVGRRWGARWHPSTVWSKMGRVMTRLCPWCDHDTQADVPEPRQQRAGQERHRGTGPCLPTGSRVEPTRAAPPEQRHTGPGRCLLLAPSGLGHPRTFPAAFPHPVSKRALEVGIIMTWPVWPRGCAGAARPHAVLPTRRLPPPRDFGPRQQHGRVARGPRHGRCLHVGRVLGAAGAGHDTMQQEGGASPIPWVC